jgi:hypothetical protein
VPGGFMEYFRTDDRGQIEDTQDRLSGRGSLFSSGEGGGFPSLQSWFGQPQSNGYAGFQGGNPFFGGGSGSGASPYAGDRQANPTGRPPGGYDRHMLR